MKAKIVSKELIIQYDYVGESIVVSDNTFDGNPGSIEFVGNTKSKIEINCVQDIIDILEDFKVRFAIVTKEGEK